MCIFRVFASPFVVLRCSSSEVDSSGCGILQYCTLGNDENQCFLFPVPRVLKTWMNSPPQARRLTCGRHKGDPSENPPPLMKPLLPLLTGEAEDSFRRHRETSRADEDERSASPPAPSSPWSSSSQRTSRRRLLSEALLLSASGSGAVLARRPSRAAALENGGEGLGQLVLPAVGPRTKRIFLARHGQVRVPSTEARKLSSCWPQCIQTRGLRLADSIKQKSPEVG